MPCCVKCGALESDLKKTMQVCGGCKNQKYCSIECQKADWEQHKGLCRAWNHVASSTATYKDLGKWLRFHDDDLKALITSTGAHQTNRLDLILQHTPSDTARTSFFLDTWSAIIESKITDTILSKTNRGKRVCVKYLVVYAQTPDDFQHEMMAVTYRHKDLLHNSDRKQPGEIIHHINRQRPKPEDFFQFEPDGKTLLRHIRSKGQQKLEPEETGAQKDHPIIKND